MKSRRVTTSLLVLSMLVAWVVAPASAGGKTPTKGVGTTSTSLQLVDVRLSAVPQLGELRAALGTAGSEATTVGDSFASVLFTGAVAGGETVGHQEVSSSDGIGSDSVSVPLSGPGIDGHLTIAELTARAGPDSAAALLRALSGQVDVGPLGLSATIGENGISSEVVEDLAASRTGAGIGPIDLEVGDLLPAELLGALPLSALLDLLDGVDLNLGATLNAQVQTLRDTLATLDTLQTKLDELAEAEAQLDELLSGNEALLAEIDAAQAEVEAAEAAVAAAEADLAEAQAAETAAQAELDALQAEKAALQAAIDDLEAQLVDCLLAIVCDPLLAQLATLNAEMAALDAEIAAASNDLAEAQADVAEAEAALAAAQAELAAARAALDALLAGSDVEAINAAQELVDTLQALIDDLLAQLQDLLGQLPDLSTLIDQLVGLLADAPLLSINELNVAVKSAADARAGRAEVQCGATGVSVLGQSLGAMTCNELATKFDELAGGILNVLKSLPVVGGAVPGVTVEGLKSSTSASDGPDADGRTSAMAGLSALHVGIPSVELEAVVDTLVADAIAQIEGVVASLPAGSDAVQQLLTTLKGQLSALPTGDALQGLETIGVDAVLGKLISRSSFQAQDASEPLGSPKNPPRPQVAPPVSHGAPTPHNAPLPFTGPDASLPLQVAIALWLLMLGSIVMMATRDGYLKTKLQRATAMTLWSVQSFTR